MYFITERSNILISLTIGKSCTDNKERNQVIELAKKAKALSQFKDMAKHMQEAIKLCNKLTEEERGMLSDAYKYLPKSELYDTLEEILYPSVQRDIDEFRQGLEKMIPALSESFEAKESYLDMLRDQYTTSDDDKSKIYYDSNKLHKGIMKVLENLELVENQVRDVFNAYLTSSSYITAKSATPWNYATVWD